MESENWFNCTTHLTGRCRVCGQLWANIPDKDGQYPDDLLDEWEVLWGFQPIRLIECGHNDFVLGEWCSHQCFLADYARLTESSGKQGVTV